MMYELKLMAQLCKILYHTQTNDFLQIVYNPINKLKQSLIKNKIFMIDLEMIVNTIIHNYLHNMNGWLTNAHL